MHRARGQAQHPQQAERARGNRLVDVADKPDAAAERFREEMTEGPDLLGLADRGQLGGWHRDNVLPRLIDESPVAKLPTVLALGDWSPEQVEARWLEERYEPPDEVERLADAAVASLRGRGSPSHDGLAARLAGYESSADRLSLELQPSRWALRLLDGEASHSLTALCLVRSADGRWLAGRRAAWLATWPKRWALGAGGAIEVGESPARTLARELQEEWRLSPESLSVQALVELPNGVAMLVGVATVADDADPVPDDEHDEWAWWPADVAGWPDEAHEQLRAMGKLLSA